MTLDNVHKRLLDALTTGVVLLDDELRPIYLNLAAESLLDISDKKARTMTMPELFIGAGDDLHNIRQAIESRSSYTKRRAELQVISGNKICVDMTVNYYDEDGQSHALLELSSIERSERISREKQLHSAAETTKELVRGLAHEIKNPLGGIRGAAQLLAAEVEDAELKDYTNVIIEEADRLHNLVDRMVGSRKPLHLADTNIHEVLERVRSVVNAEIRGKSIEITDDYDPSIPPLMADGEQLIQAMLNLVRNAKQALESPNVDHCLGRIQLKTRVTRNITIGSNFHRLAVTVEISDNGPGIDEDMIETIFYPMVSGRPEGTGLGLPITHGIINQHRGLIECHSEPGKTTFTVILPLD